MLFNFNLKLEMQLRLLLVCFTVIQTFHLLAQSNEFSKYILNSRIGIGTGINLYTGTAGDAKITFAKGNYSELKNATDFFVLTKLNSKWDVGFRYTQGHLWSFFVNSQILAFEAHTQDIQIIANRDITPAFFNGYQFSLEALFGAGFANFQSKMYSTDPSVSAFSTSIGYGRNETNAAGIQLHQASTINTFLISTGLKLNYHIHSLVNIFWESRLNLTSTGKLSGNMFRKSNIPPDAFWSNLIGLEFSLGRNKNNSKRISCPRF